KKNSNRPTGSMVGRYRNNTILDYPAIQAAPISLATGYAANFNSTRLAKPLTFMPVQPNTTSWTPRAGRPCDYAETSSKTTGTNPMGEYGIHAMPMTHFRLYSVSPGYVVSHGTWIVGKQPVLRRWQIPSWPRLVLQVSVMTVPGRSAPIFQVQTP